MNKSAEPDAVGKQVDTGLYALCGIASYYRIAADPGNLQRELALTGHTSDSGDIVRAAKLVGLKARIIDLQGASKHPRKLAKRLDVVPTPAIVKLQGGSFNIFGGRTATGLYRLVDPVTRIDRELPINDLVEEMESTSFSSRGGRAAKGSIHRPSAFAGFSHRSGATGIPWRRYSLRRSSCSSSRSSRLSSSKS